MIKLKEHSKYKIAFVGHDEMYLTLGEEYHMDLPKYVANKMQFFNNNSSYKLYNNKSIVKESENDFVTIIVRNNEMYVRLGHPLDGSWESRILAIQEI